MVRLSFPAFISRQINFLFLHISSGTVQNGPPSITQKQVHFRGDDREICTMVESQTNSNSKCSSLQIWLAEYEAVQQSAQHHDLLLWSVTSIIWAGNLVILGFIISNIRNACLLFVVIMVFILGIAMIFSVWKFMSQFHAIKKQKYERCKIIEKIIEDEFGIAIRQHRDVEWSEGSQKTIYGVLTILFIITWAMVFITYLVCSGIAHKYLCH